MKVLLDLDFGLNPKFQQWITNTCRMRTKRETSTWLRKITEERLSITMRDSLEHAKVFFGGFSGDHKTFMSWNKDFLQQERKMKKEAQQRLMGDVGGQESTMLLLQAPIVHLRQDLDSFLKIICVKSVRTGSKMKQK